MGSFAEVVISFPVRDDVGDGVLAAFASIARPSAGAPPIPEPVQDPDPFALEWLAEIGGDPWDHDWGTFLGSPMDNVYLPSHKVAAMTWAQRRWVVTARTTIKSDSEAVIDILKFLGPVIDTADALPDAPGLFLGYVRHQGEPRPWLLWAMDGRVLAENLNSPGAVY